MRGLHAPVTPTAAPAASGGFRGVVPPCQMTVEIKL